VIESLKDKCFSTAFKLHLLKSKLYIERASISLKECDDLDRCDCIRELMNNG
jgi:hypothetical protein